MKDDDTLPFGWPWITLGGLIGALWTNILGSKAGTRTYCVVATAIGAWVYYDPERPFLVLAAPVAILALAFVIFLAFIAGMVGDGIAGWVFERMVRNPDPDNFFHQALRFLLSCVGLIVGAYIVGAGNLPGD